MKRVALLLTVFVLAGCDEPSGSYPHRADEIELNARLSVGDGSLVMARYFTVPEAITVRGWGSTAGVWAFAQADVAFDVDLNDITPDGPELWFLAEGATEATKIPSPPGVTPRDLPEHSSDAGWGKFLEDEDRRNFQTTARFVSSPDPMLLAIRKTTETADVLMRLLSGVWVIEGITDATGDAHLRETGPRVATLELADGTPAMLRAGQVIPLDSPPAALMVPPRTKLQFGPFDGTRIRVFWAPEPHLLCTGTWNLETDEGDADDCLDLVTPHGGALLASGTVDDTLFSVREVSAFGTERALLARVSLGVSELLGAGGYGLAFAHESPFRTPVGLQPVHSENACEFSENLYAVSRYFRTDGTFGFVRCLQTLPTHTSCGCQRQSDLKGCAGCGNGELNVLGMFRTGVNTWRMVGLHHLDGRYLIRTSVWEHDTNYTTSADPTDALQDYTGSAGYGRAYPVLGNVPGFARDPARDNLVNVSQCTTVTGPSGAITMNPDETFTIDVRDDHVLRVACDPDDGGPPLPVIEAIAPSVIDNGEPVGRGVHEAWNLVRVPFMRGLWLPEDIDPLSTQTQHPSRPMRILTAPDGAQFAVEWDAARDEITTRSLPAGATPLTFVPSLDLVVTADGQVIALASGTLLGVVPPGTLSADHRTWRGGDRSVWALFPDQPPRDLGAYPMQYGLRAASRSGLLVVQTPAITAYEPTSGQSTPLFVGNAIDLAAVSDDGNTVVILEHNYGGTDQGRIFVYRRVADCAASTCLPGDLPFTQELVCTGCDAFLTMDPATGNFLYSPDRNSVVLYAVATGAQTPVQNVAVAPLDGGQLFHIDAFGAYWWHQSPTRLFRYDPTTDGLTQYDISQAPDDTSNGVMHHLTGQLFRGVAVGKRIYAVTSDGLEIAWEPRASGSAISPLAGNRGSQVVWSSGSPNQGTAYFYYGERTVSGTDLVNTYENASAGTASNPQPEALYSPCDLGAPTYPDWVTTAPRGLVCMR